MADLGDIQDQVRALAERPKNVEAKEICRILDDLNKHPGFESGYRDTGHGLSCFINDKTFSICTHNRGSKQLKPCYVKSFIKAAIEVGIYEDY
jgi:hypothetical protein